MSPVDPKKESPWDREIRVPPSLLSEGEALIAVAARFQEGGEVPALDDLGQGPPLVRLFPVVGLADAEAQEVAQVGGASGRCGGHVVEPVGEIFVVHLGAELIPQPLFVGVAVLPGGAEGDLAGQKDGDELRCSFGDGLLQQCGVVGVVALGLLGVHQLVGDQYGDIPAGGAENVVEGEFAELLLVGGGVRRQDLGAEEDDPVLDGAAGLAGGDAEVEPGRTEGRVDLCEAPEGAPHLLPLLGDALRVGADGFPEARIVQCHVRVHLAGTNELAHPGVDLVDEEGLEDRRPVRCRLRQVVGRPETGDVLGGDLHIPGDLLPVEGNEGEEGGEENSEKGRDASHGSSQKPVRGFDKPGLRFALGSKGVQRLSKQGLKKQGREEYR